MKPFSTLRTRLRCGGDALDNTREEYFAVAVVSRYRWRVAQVTLGLTLLVTVVVTIAILSQPDVPRATPLWADEFDETLNGWMIDPRNAFVDDDQLILQPLRDTLAIATHRLPIANFIVETYATPQGATDNAYGFVVGTKEELSAFLISSDGYFSVMQRVAGQWREVRPWRQWPHVQRDAASNRLRLTCNDTLCRFYVNGEITIEIGSATQRDTIGLIASRYTNGMLSVGFDNLRIWLIPP